MAEATRVRPVEYYNPRPLILGLCFAWGIAVGFGLNFFRSPEVLDNPNSSPSEQISTTARPIPSEIERRRQDIPNVAEVEPAPVSASSIKQTLENVPVEPPAAILTTEGGLTGRTAQPIRPQTSSASSSPVPASPTGTSAGTPPPPPPIPDLSPW